jgi:transmembrane sensor
MRTTNPGAPRPETSPEAEAAFWDSRLRSPACTEADRAAFTEWRDRHPDHAAAYDALQGAIGALHAAFDFSAELRSMRDRALEHRPTPRWRMAAAIAAGVVLASGALFLPAGVPPDRGLQVGAGASAFQTGVGERLTVTLADGSEVTLNTRSRVEVNYAAGRRDVKLVTGQAVFEVAKDRGRPFVVTAGSRRVTALGTVFEVRLDGEKVKVTMLEGKVAVEPTRPTVLQKIVAPERELAAGEQLVASADSLGVSVSRTDAQAATSWRQGRVVFVDTPLTEAVAEMNRYSATPIIVGDASLSRYKVNGMFLTNQPLSFVGAVTAYYPVEARSGAQGATVLAPRG